MLPRSAQKMLHGAVGGVGFKVTDWIGLIPSHIARRALYRAIGVELASGAHIYGGAELRAPRRIRIGERTSVGRDVILDGRGGLTLGSDVNLSSQVAIWTMQHDPSDPDFGVQTAPVTIGDRAWLSFRTTILPGVTVGEGAVVAAGAVVTKDVRPFTVVAGVPATELRERTHALCYRIPAPTPFV